MHAEVLRYLMVIGLVKTLMFGADMNSSVHIDNKKEDILILGKGLTNDLDDTTLTAEKEYFINVTEQQKSLHYNKVNKYMFVNKKVQSENF